MQQKHSPLPFALKQGQGFEYLVNGAGYKILEFGLVDNPKDLVFIVQACNAHGVLLQACKDALYYLRQCEMDFSLPPSAKTMKDILEEAIAKAESK